MSFKASTMLKLGPIHVTEVGMFTDIYLHTQNRLSARHRHMWERIICMGIATQGESQRGMQLGWPRTLGTCVGVEVHF